VTLGPTLYGKKKKIAMLFNFWQQISFKNNFDAIFV
jgi:hypothetical protein